MRLALNADVARFESVKWSADLTSIVDDFTNWMTFVDDEVCQCAAEDDND